MDGTSIYSLDHKVALITGGGSGIGLGIARQFIALGAKVVITGRDIKKLSEANKSLEEKCYVYQNDVTNKNEHATLINTIQEEVGELDILVNNAGVHHKTSSIEATDEDFQAVMDININSVFALTREVLRGMVVRKRGSIINISSMAAIYGLPMVVAYSSSKTAVLGLTRALASEFSYSGVRINAIAPGFIESAMLKKVMETDPERKRRVLDRTPLKRFGTTDEIGYAAAFLASEASEFITGICLPVDGGNSIGF